MQIWKSKLDLTDVQLVTLPHGARPVHFGPDPNGALCVWCEVEPMHTTKNFGFVVVGTGHDIPAGFQYVGSAVNLPFVWHCYYNVT